MYDTEDIRELKLKLYEVKLKIKSYEKEIRLYLPNDFRWRNRMDKLLRLKSMEYELTDKIQMRTAKNQSSI